MSKIVKLDSGLYSVTGSLTSDQDYFDDCPICQALKKAEDEKRIPTAKEYEEATREAEKQGAVVGGKIFDERLN